MNITVSKLKGANPKNLLRLAKSLDLNTGGLSHGHLARLVRWRITRPTERFNTSEKKEDYVNLWKRLFDK